MIVLYSILTACRIARASTQGPEHCPKTLRLESSLDILASLATESLEVSPLSPALANRSVSKVPPAQLGMWRGNSSLACGRSRTNPVVRLYGTLVRPGPGGRVVGV